MHNMILALIITAAAMLCFLTEVLPYSITAMGAAIVMALLGIIDFSDVYSGLGNDTILLCIGAMVLGIGCQESGLAARIGQLLSHNFAKTEKMFLFAVVVVTSLLSMFMSNITVVAMLIPIVTAVAEHSGGVIQKKNVYLPLGIASGVGGLGTLIGSPPQMVAQGLLTGAGYAPVSFFGYMKYAMPLFVLLIVYILTIGPRLLRTGAKEKETGAVPTAQAQAILRSAQAEASEKDQRSLTGRQITCLVILLGSIAAFVSQIVPSGIVAMIGGLAMIATGCVDFRKAYASVDWSTIIFTAGTLSFAKGISASGAGEWMADGVLHLLGDNPSHAVILMALCACTTVITNFISNVTATAMMVPIALSIAASTGMDTTTMVMAITVSASLSFATPMGNPSMVLTSGLGEYRFKDFLKYGALFTVLGYAITMACALAFVAG